jgi:hypothetical protein
VCVLLPIYAALQVAAGGLQLAAVTNRFQPISWMRHLGAAGLCLLVSGLLRLGEFFVTRTVALTFRPAFSAAAVTPSPDVLT